jgi:hypothetical protein
MLNKQLEMVNKFTKVLDEFDAVIKKVPEEGLDWSEKEGEWSIRQVIHHIADDCNVYAFIIEQALALPEPKIVFGDFPGNEAWADGLGFDKRPVQTPLDLIHAHRAFLAELVGHFKDRWEKKAMFYDQTNKKIGENTVEEMISMLTDHMTEHTQMIENILKANQ